MRNETILLFLAMIVAGIFAFSGPWTAYPVYVDPYAITAYEFAGFLFWMFLLLFILALVLSQVSKRKSIPVSKNTEVAPRNESIIATGFLVAIYLIVISVIAAIFGFGFVSSTFAGLAMVVFWIALILTFAALVIGFFEQRTPKR